MILQGIKAFSNRAEAEKCYIDNNNWLKGIRAIVNYQGNVKMWIVKIYKIGG
jgi:hypothetical protein